MSDDRLVSRNEVRKMGLNVSSTQFGRYEEAGYLVPIKPGGVRSSRVYYWLSEVLKFLAQSATRSPQRKPS
jgi:hypothetical protein